MLEPAIVPNASTEATDHEANQNLTGNVTPEERSSTDMSESDSDHDINWELKPTGIISPSTEQKTKSELISEYEHSPHQSDTETYSLDDDTNDDDKVSVTSKTTTAEETKSNKFPTTKHGDSVYVTKNASNKEADNKQLHKEHSNTESDNENSTHSDDNQLHVESLKSRGRKRKRIHSSDNNSGDETTPSKPKKRVTASRKSPTTSQNNTSKGKTRKFKCPNCKQITISVQELNAHYRETHSPVKCGSCTKTFATPSGLHKHKYVHQEKLFKCKDCDKKYPFLSQLQSHELTHLDTSDFVCDHKGCGKTFKRKNEFDRHVVVHDKIEHACEHPDCDYVNYDIRNLVAHRKIHNPEVKSYKCEYCGKLFLHFTQRSRHYDGECTEMPSSKK